MSSPGVGGTISAASDVNFNNPQDGQYLRRSGGKWSNQDAPAGSSFATLTDTNITAPTNGQKLIFNSTSSKWENISGGIPLATVSLPGTLSTGTIGLAFPLIGTWVFGTLIVNVGSPSTGGAIVTDLRYNGTTIFGTPANRPSIAAGGSWTTSGAPSVTQYIGSTSTRGYLEFSIVSIGSAGTEGADLVATLYASRIA